MRANYRMPVLNAVLVLTLAGCYWGRRIESATVARPDFLTKLSMPFHGWKTQEFSLSPVEQQTLEPDAALVRRYLGPSGQSAELAIIAGHRKRTVHTPGFCMLGDGWQLLSQRDATLALPGRPLPVTRALMLKDGHRVLVTYFFTDGDYSTPSLVRFQGVQLVKRFRSEMPLGALVRIIVPVGLDASERLSDDFARATLPTVLDAMKRERVRVP